jgi:hypothetical protein
MLIPVICLLLLMAGLVCFCFAAWRPAPPAPRNLEALGLAFWILAELITKAAAFH